MLLLMLGLRLTSSHGLLSMVMMAPNGLVLKDLNLPLTNLIWLMKEEILPKSPFTKPLTCSLLQEVMLNHVLLESEWLTRSTCSSEMIRTMMVTFPSQLCLDQVVVVPVLLKLRLLLLSESGTKIRKAVSVKTRMLVNVNCKSARLPNNFSMPTCEHPESKVFALNS